MSNLVRKANSGLVGSLRNDLFDPFEDLFNGFFDDFFSHPTRMVERVKTIGGYPKLDIVTEGDKWIIKAALPGVSSNDVNIEVTEVGNNRVLRLTGKMAEEYRSPENSSYHLRELHKSSFSRQLTLPDYIEGEPDAKMKNGILTLTWKHKVESAKPEVKRINITEDQE